MGSGSSCYPSRDHQQGSMDAEPYDTRRLLSDLITVHTAIVLSDDIDERREGCKTTGGGGRHLHHQGDRRTSIEYTITTSLTVPLAGPAGAGGALSSAGGTGRDLHGFPGAVGLELPAGGLVDIMTAHFKHKVDVVTRASGQGLMTTIQEVSELSSC